jgi:hypothetical protein
MRVDSRDASNTINTITTKEIKMEDFGPHLQIVSSRLSEHMKLIVLISTTAEAQVELVQHNCALWVYASARKTDDAERATMDVMAAMDVPEEVSQRRVVLVGDSNSRDRVEAALRFGSELGWWGGVHFHKRVTVDKWLRGFPSRMPSHMQQFIHQRQSANNELDAVETAHLVKTVGVGQLMLELTA